MTAVKPENATIDKNTLEDCIYGENCPLHAENPPFNARVLAAMQEAKDIASGKIPGEWYTSIDEARKDLNV
jgi:hypothetical protein